MRSTIIAAAAFAASVAAVPYAQPDVVTVYATDVAYVTNVVTVTQGAGQAATTVAVQAEPTPENHGGWHWPHKQHKPKSRKTRTRTRTSTPAAAPTTEQAPPPPAYTPEPEPTEQPAPAPSGGSGLGGYSGAVVDHHNVHRTNHSAPALEWSDALAATAEKSANSCVYAHDVETDKSQYGEYGYGQNIAAGVESANISAVITDLFYNGEVGFYENLYGQATPDMSNFHGWGHFSQIVWKSTTKVGCATVHCPNGLANTGANVSPYFTVCNYDAPGNFGGQYAENVIKPDGNPTVDWSYSA